MAAACALLDRGYGCPTQQIKVDQDINLGLAHLEALKALTSKAQEANPVQELIESATIEKEEKDSAIIDLIADHIPCSREKRSEPGP